MLTSAPFDNWWHAAYGLDVKIVSPPHMLLIAGIFAIEMGVLVLILSNMNRASERVKNQYDWLFLYLGAMIVTVLEILLMEYVDRPLLHSSFPYRMTAIFIPVVLAGIWRAWDRNMPPPSSPAFTRYSSSRSSSSCRFSRRTQAWAGLSAGHPVHSARLPDAYHSSCALPRPALAAHAFLEHLVARGS